MIITYNIHFDGFEIYDGFGSANNGIISNTSESIISVNDVGVGVDTISIRDITAIRNSFRFSVQAELAIYDWMVHTMNCDGTDWGATVIWDKPNKTRPQKPYITLNITNGPTSIDTVDIAYVSTDTYAYTYRKIITLTINVFSDNGYLYHINKILNSFTKECCYSHLRDAGLAYWTHSGPSDISELLDSEFEFRATADVVLSFGHTETVTSGEMHKVKINDWSDVDIN